ncbi:response regulator transcription factor [Paenibacillus sp. DXFW5]|uniref:Response regulator transcription factor n=1 Tax=Paenibacillus rhizolycopersici TaxID=2780073 RepID=A0ABS2HBN2_9BACL|nr:response regulator transcription factor [Paenibacillus rhizolycopersici]MBM6996994.1 response regulator transcription factor [Paenibacillus rhizolycopersici]
MWKIAIVDDERQVLQGMKRAIPWEQLGAEWVGEALNGADGLDVVRQTEPDIVITDIYMPAMNGIDMIEQLRKDGYDGKVIIFSGYSDFEHARQALRFNVSDYVSKPISVPTLKTILTKVIGELTEEEESRQKQGEMERKLSLYEPFIEKEWVRSAVVGTLDSSYREAGRLPEPYRYWTNFSHVTIGIDLVRDARVSEFSLSDWNLFRFAIRNIACEVARKMFSSVEYTELHSTRAVLMVHPRPEEPAELLDKKLHELGVKLINAIKCYLKLVVRVGIGGVKRQWLQIPESTEEAFRAIELRAGRRDPAYALYAYQEDEDDYAFADNLFSVKFYVELASALKASQEAEAKKLVADYMSRLELQKAMTPESVQILASELWGVFTYCLYEAGVLLNDLVPGEQITKELVGLTGPEQLTEWLSDKITLICSSRQWRGNNKHRQVVDYMTGYIHEHYAEDITLAELSEKLYISRNHLSIIFKNITGETFNNYLTRVRIEKARELLLQRTMLVYEVAERVGYKNVPYFSTLFKKITGMNPTDLIK